MRKKNNEIARLNLRKLKYEQEKSVSQLAREMGVVRQSLYNMSGGVKGGIVAFLRWAKKNNINPYDYLEI